MRTYVVTGAASGLGLATAKLPTDQGHTSLGVGHLSGQVIFVDAGSDVVIRGDSSW